VNKFIDFNESDLRENEIVIPFDLDKLPEYLQDLVEKDSQFRPEVCTQNLENTLFQES
jgi:hypothetical protein